MRLLHLFIDSNNKQRNRYSISHRQIRVLRIDVFFSRTETEMAFGVENFEIQISTVTEE
jgi:hypothetical protein